MENTLEFIVKKLPEPKSTKARERDELHSDFSAFPENIQPILGKYLGHKILTPEEDKVVTQAIGRWWQDKYGFPHTNKVARTEVLRLKYSVPKELVEVNKLQEELFLAVKKNDLTEIKALKKTYEEKCPDQLEGVEVLFQFHNFLKDQRAIDSATNYETSRRDIFESITQFQFLMTHFVSSNGNDKEFLNNFWGVLEEMARATGNPDNIITINKLRRGVLSQVAIYKICDKLGIKPKLSHPREDAFDAIDMWTNSSETPIQIKGARDDQQKPTLIETEAMPFPAVQMDSQNQTTFLNPYLKDQTKKFRMKLSEYERKMGKHLKGYLMVIPYSKFDFVTGEPSDEIVEFFKNKLEEINKGAGK